MSLQNNAANLNFATQYAVDKIVGVYQDSFDVATQTTSPALGFYQYAIPHQFTRPLFCELLISSDGINYYDGGQTTGAVGISYSDSNNVYILTNVSSGILYYKIICSWIDNYDTTNPSITPVTQNTTNTAYFDSRQNYQKIFMQDVQTASTLGSDNILPVFHNLGYQPNAKVFFEAFPGQVWPQIDGGTNDFWLYDPTHQSECYAIITSTNLNIDVFIPAAGSGTRAWYRIYIDQ